MGCKALQFVVGVRGITHRGLAGVGDRLGERGGVGRARHLSAQVWHTGGQLDNVRLGLGFKTLNRRDGPVHGPLSVQSMMPGNHLCDIAATAAALLAACAAALHLLTAQACAGPVNAGAFVSVQDGAHPCCQGGGGGGDAADTSEIQVRHK